MDLLTPSFTITINPNDCLRLAPFLLLVSSIVTDLVLIYESITSTNDER
jgi:hypothetical protein